MSDTLQNGLPSPFFTWQQADALQISNDDMKLHIRFLASNVDKADLKVIKHSVSPS